MADLLSEVNTNIPSRMPPRTVKTEARRKTRVLSPPVAKIKPRPFPKPSIDNVSHPSLKTPPHEETYDEDMVFAGDLDDEFFPTTNEMPSSPIANAVERKGQSCVKAEEDEEEDMMEVAQAVGDYNIKSACVNISGTRPISKPIKDPPYPSPESSSPPRIQSDHIDSTAWNEVTSKLNVLSSQVPETSSHAKLKIEDALEDDGNLRMFWTDYTEVNGNLCLFGKVKDKNNGTYVSAFVKVDNILRKLYFLPRVYRQRKQECVPVLYSADLI